jgi:hypothetical protein
MLLVYHFTNSMSLAPLLQIQYSKAMTSPEEQKLQKQEQWDSEVERFSTHVGDKLGRGLDEITIEPVVGLNVYGLKPVLHARAT